MQRLSLFLTLCPFLPFESSPRHPQRADELLSCTSPSRAGGMRRLGSQRLLCSGMLLQLVLKAWLDIAHTTSRAPSRQLFPPRLGSLLGLQGSLPLKLMELQSATIFKWLAEKKVGRILFYLQQRVDFKCSLWAERKEVCFICLFLASPVVCLSGAV